MTKKIVKATFIKTESYQILFDLEDCKFGNSHEVDMGLLEELCWDATAKNEGLLLGISSHVSWDLLDVPDLKMPKMPEKVGPYLVVEKNGQLMIEKGNTDE